MKSIAENIFGKVRGYKSLMKNVEQEKVADKRFLFDRHLYVDTYLFKDNSMIDVTYINQQAINCYVRGNEGKSKKF